MDKRKRTVCVFCGSSRGNKPSYAAAAKEIGNLIAREGFSLVCGGGGLGLMGETARAVRDGGAEVIGILPDFLRHLEPPLARGESVRVVPDLFERKRQMLDADAFIVLPGGLGTMDEFYEVVTSAQLEVHRRPIVLLNVDGYYDPLIALMKHIVREGFAKPSSLDLYRVAATAKEAMAFLTQAPGSKSAP